LGMRDSSGCRWRRGLLLWSSVGCSFTLLSFTHETFDKVHVLRNDGLIDTMALEVSEERIPRWVDASRCEAFLWVVAHMRNVDE
jgi:hypothetical protein